MSFKILFTIFALWAYEPKALDRVAEEVPPEMEGVGIQEKLGASLDLSLPVRDELGIERPLSFYINGQVPTIFSPVYYSCPRLCNFHLNGVFEALKGLKWEMGRQYQLVALSFDDRETPELATEKKTNYLKMYGMASSQNGVHFLTASKGSIAKITEQLGFRYKWNSKSQEWAHASAAIIVTPGGVISRYLHGVVFETATVKWAIAEASSGKVGSFVDRMIWYCLHYDPSVSRYTIYAVNLMKLGGLLIILFLVALLLPQYLRSRRASMRGELNS